MDFFTTTAKKIIALKKDGKKNSILFYKYACDMLYNFDDNKKYDISILKELLDDSILIIFPVTLTEKLFKNVILQEPNNEKLYRHFCLYIKLFVIEYNTPVSNIEKALDSKNMKQAFEYAMSVEL